MANNDKPHRTDLPKILDDGTNNNYGEWKTKLYHKLREWDLLKYIKGPKSTPPAIPPLRLPTEYHGLNELNQIATVRDLGNVVEHQQAITNAKPWMSRNNTTLSRIISALPSQQLHLVKSATYAKEAWDALRSYYQPQNSLCAATIKGQIMAYRCTPDMNIEKWLSDMQRLYISLCDLELE